MPVGIFGCKTFEIALKYLKTRAKGVFSGISRAYRRVPLKPNQEYVIQAQRGACGLGLARCDLASSPNPTPSNKMPAGTGDPLQKAGMAKKT